MFKYLVKAFLRDSGELAVQVVVPKDCVFGFINEFDQEKYLIKANILEDKEDV